MPEFIPLEIIDEAIAYVHEYEWVDNFSAETYLMIARAYALGASRHSMRDAIEVPKDVAKAMEDPDALATTWAVAIERGQDIGRREHVHNADTCDGCKSIAKSAYVDGTNILCDPARFVDPKKLQDFFENRAKLACIPGSYEGIAKLILANFDVFAREKRVD